MKKLRVVFLICVIAVCAYDLFAAYVQGADQLLDPTSISKRNPGYQFIGLETLFKDVRTIGYYTDKDIDNNNPRAVAQFEQAQYMLAPTVLDLNHTQYHWVIFDCTTPQSALSIIKNLGFSPMKMYNGIILAYNPHGS